MAKRKHSEIRMCSKLAFGRQFNMALKIYAWRGACVMGLLFKVLAHILLHLSPHNILTRFKHTATYALILYKEDSNK